MAWASLSFRSETSSADFERPELPAQRHDLLIENLDLGERAGVHALLAVERARELVELALGLAELPLHDGGARSAFGGGAQAVALVLGARQARPQARDLVLEIDLAGLLERQQIGELGDLDVEAGERGVLAGHLLREEELHHHEHGEQEDDAENEGRQRVDEAGPVVDAAFAASACECHVSSPDALRPLFSPDAPGRAPSFRAAA